MGDVEAQSVKKCYHPKEPENSKIKIVPDTLVVRPGTDGTLLFPQVLSSM
ncbi:hypothetical protein WN55_10007 [Dufourea novaeangliae]|uniref:Uncharacterized protein n=1 Tax=Dufourea novaeangliae TaxID=178035 RepID=A0A154P880_DUFNO|nr:hypothetical protein WN55_10007 [Dufourea novaeangliae]